MKNNKVRIEGVIKNAEANQEMTTMKELKANNIMRERLEIYKDFVINLVCYAHTTYFGKEFIKTEKDIKGHFNWAFDKVISDFKIEGIEFPHTDDLRDYFYEYFINQFYGQEILPTAKYYISFWTDIFNVYGKKQTKDVLKILVDLYVIFDNALENKKNQNLIIA